MEESPSNGSSRYDYEVGELVEIFSVRNGWVPGVVTAVLADDVFGVETKTSDDRIHVTAAAAAVRALYRASMEKREVIQKAEAESERLAQRAFGYLRVEEAFEWLAQYADARGKVSRPMFYAALGCTGENFLEEAGANLLFCAFDADGDGGIDLSELAAGLSLWCRGSQADRIQAAFSLFDADGDGRIDFGEMVRYMSSVFKVALASKPELRLAAEGATAHELAEATAHMVFASADKNNDGVLSLQEFAQWYTSQSGIVVPEEVDSLVTEEDAVRILSNALRGRDPREVWLKFMAEADFSDSQEAPRLSRQAFYRALDSLYVHQVPNELDAVAGRAFELFDADHNGFVDARELAAGLSALCGGSRDAKVRFCFQLFDTDSDGFLDREELAMCLSSVFRVSSYQGGLPEPPDELAVATAEAMLEACGKALEGRISYDDFDHWLGNSTEHTDQSLLPLNHQEHTPLDDPDDPNKAIAAISSSSPLPMLHTTQTPASPMTPTSQNNNTLTKAAIELRRARILLGLDSSRISVDDVVDVILEAADPAGRIDAVSLAKALRRLARLSQVTDRQAAAALSRRIFEALAQIDPTPQPSVTAHDLAAGLAVLCPDPVTDRVEAVFGLFAPATHAALDANGLQALLTAVFTFLSAVSDAVQSSLTSSPADLAAATSQKCFDDLGLEPTEPSLDPRDFSLFVSKDVSPLAPFTFF